MELSLKINTSVFLMRSGIYGGCGSCLRRHPKMAFSEPYFSHLYCILKLYQRQAGLICAAARAQCDAIRGRVNCCVKL